MSLVDQRGLLIRLQHATHRSFTVAVAAVGFAALVVHAAGPANFKPDGTFTGSTLAGWHVVGDADWKAQDGELIGTAKPGTNATTFGTFAFLSKPGGRGATPAPAPRK